MSWRDELRDSARLRLGLVLIAAVLGVYGLLEWHDSQQLRAGQQQRLAGQVARLSNAQAMAVWPQRQREAQAALQAQEQRMWRHTSLGLAQAQFQDWLREQLRLANAASAAVRIAESTSLTATRPDAASNSAGIEATAGSLSANAPVRVGAQVEFALTDPQLLVALLAALSASPRAVLVESLVVKGQRVEMRLTANFLIGAVRGAS